MSVHFIEPQQQNKKNTQNETKQNYAISRNSKEQYRTFKLISVNDHPITANFHATNTRNEGSNTSIGASRAANKIFNNYCNSFGVHVGTTIVFKIQETTQGGKKHGKVYDFIATREELDIPICVEKVNGKLSKISSLDVASNPANVIQYKYKNVVKASNKS